MSENGRWFCATHAWYNSNATPCPYCAPASPPPAATASAEDEATFHEHLCECGACDRVCRQRAAEVARLTADSESLNVRIRGLEADLRRARLPASFGELAALKEALDPLRASPTEPLDGIARRVIREAKNMRAERDEMTEKRHVEIVRADAAEAALAALRERCEALATAVDGLLSDRETTRKNARHMTTWTGERDWWRTHDDGGEREVNARDALAKVRALASVERGANP